MLFSAFGCRPFAVQPLQVSRRLISSFTCATQPAPLLANGPGLVLDVGEKRWVTFSLQPHPDKRTEDDLEAHRQLEHGRRLARDDASLIQRVLRKNEEESCLVLEYQHYALLPKRGTSLPVQRHHGLRSPARTGARPGRHR